MKIKEGKNCKINSGNFVKTSQSGDASVIKIHRWVRNNKKEEEIECKRRRGWDKKIAQDLNILKRDYMEEVFVLWSSVQVCLKTYGFLVGKIYIYIYLKSILWSSSSLLNGIWRLGGNDLDLHLS